MIFKEITFSIAEKMGVYKNNTYFSDDVDDFLPIGFIRKSSNTIKIITKKIWYCAEKKSNRVEVVTFDAIRFDFDAISFQFGAVRFCFGKIQIGVNSAKHPFFAVFYPKSIICRLMVCFSKN